MDAIKDKKIWATAMQSPKQMARTAAEMADKFLKGERGFSKKTPLQVKVVTQENIDEFGAYGSDN